jgi:hypothetical protein
VQASNARDTLRDHVVEARRAATKLLLTAESESPAALGAPVARPISLPSVFRSSVAEVD